jgi:D-3-phosphoglycerate dehydrogenase / 2-oxoglutarate reductase
MTERLRILAVGDPFVTAEAFRAGLEERLGGRHDIETAQVADARTPPPRTPSEERLREYAGSPDTVAALVPGHDVLVVHGAPVSDAVLDVPGLRLVCCARGGPVNVDLTAAAQRGIPVTNTPGKNAQAVVELTIGFLIMLARGVYPAQRFLLDGGALGESTFEGAEFFGVELSGRTLGLVGYGQVGRRVGAAAAALGMRVLAFDPVVPAADHADGVEPAAFERVLADSDFVSMHARVTPQNESMMAAAQFAAMRAGAFFVNTARETLVDEAALLAALRSGHLGGAALDVVRPAAGGRNPLLDERSVVITPHVGGATAETIRRGVAMVADDIDRFSRGEALRYAT